MRLSALVLALTLTSPLVAAPRHWQSGDALDQVMVQWRSAVPSAAELAAEASRLGLHGPKGDPISALHAQAGAQAIQRTALLPIDVVQLRAGLSAADIDRALDIYRASPLVLSAEPDPPIRAAALAALNDPVFLDGHQWGLTRTAWLQARQAYDAGAISFHAVITVAVLDTGIGPHTDLASPLSGKSFVSGVTVTADDNGHGTFCSGLIAATPNKAGIAGAFIDPAYIRLLPVKVLDACGSGSYAGIVSGILYAVDRGAQVLNISIQGYADSDILHAAVVEADQRGAVLVAAAGNDSREAAWPAAYGSVISVGALDDQDGPASYSNTGKLDLSAPGGAGASACGSCTTSPSPSVCLHEIWSLTAQQSGCPSGSPANPACALANAFEGGAGTSFAAPLVSAAAAMLLAQDSSLRPLDVMQRLVQSASTTSQGSGFHAQSGWGKLNFYAALTLKPSSSVGSSLRIYNWPNPFSVEKDGGTNFTFFLPQAQAAELRVLDDGGDLVRRWSLDAGQTFAGMNLLHWDGLNGAGRKAANGGYRLLLQSEGARATCRVAVLR